MKPCKVPPGDDAMADAYNLAYCAYVAHYSPAATAAAERMVKTISARVNDWEQVSAALALIAATGLRQLDLIMPEDKKPSEGLRLAIEADNLAPV